MKERELQNLLRWLPGYEASQVNFKGEKPMGFALFSTAQLAVAAKDALQVFISSFLRNYSLDTSDLFIWNYPGIFFFLICICKFFLIDV